MWLSETQPDLNQEIVILFDDDIEVVKFLRKDKSPPFTFRFYNKLTDEKFRLMDARWKSLSEVQAFIRDEK